ncbi:putative methyltransferase-domain-containing protein [Limtongia smithiae]|uniref:putative methyltransferase-domain-containing protein n=1 Tax=Limtongia smithiae TaxID=1125753 RepID=UPI0034CF3612
MAATSTTMDIADPATHRLIICRAVHGFRLRDWLLASLPRLEFVVGGSGGGRQDVVVPRASQRARDELSALIEHCGNKTATMPLALLLRAQCFVDSDALEEAAQDIVAVKRATGVRFSYDDDDDLVPFARISRDSTGTLVCEINAVLVDNLHARIMRGLAALDDGSGMRIYAAPEAAGTTTTNTNDERGDSVCWGGNIFRIVPRDPFPERVLRCVGGRGQDGTVEVEAEVHYALVNEMSLFPRELRTVERIWEVNVRVVSIDGGPVSAEFVGARPVAMTGVSPRRARGAVLATLRVVPADEFYLQLEYISRDDDMFRAVVPLVLGPFRASTSIHDEEEEPVQTYRPLYVHSDDAVYIQESLSDLPGKIWDSAYFLMEAVAQNLAELPDGCSVLDLSSGNGAVGLYLRRRMHGRRLQICLTDLPDAVALIRDNAERVVADGTASVEALTWGDENAVKTLPFAPFDVVIACDLIYENEYFPALLRTLEQVVVPSKTSLYLGYKKRGLTAAEKASIWAELQARFAVVELMENVPETAISGEQGLLSSNVGVEVWRMQS